MLSKNKLNRLYFLGFILFLMSSCTGYNKLLKSSDLTLKYEKAKEYYNAEKYYRAYPLFEELVTVYRGTAKAEELVYLFAYTDYHLGDYLLAGHRFEQFTKTFPTSKYVEECDFMSAYCDYLLSPNYSLDQEFTISAINALQLFIDNHPRSSRIDTCNILVEELEYKLEKKAYKASKQYLKMEDYNAACVTFQNLLNEFPDTEYREEIYFLTFKARFLLARKSVEKKKLERIEDAFKAYITFVDRFPQSEYITEAETYYSELQYLKEKTLSVENKK